MQLPGASLASGLILGACLALSASVAHAQSEADHSPPDGSGRYSIGHTTLVITDTSRNPDGSVPVTTSGRPLFLHVWYPTAVQATQHITYTWNNPVYSQNDGGSVYPGLPDLPALSFTGSTSFNPVAEHAPLAGRCVTRPHLGRVTHSVLDQAALQTKAATVLPPGYQRVLGSPT